MRRQFTLSESLRALHEAESRALDRIEARHFGGRSSNGKRVDPHRRELMSEAAQQEATAVVKAQGTGASIVMGVMERGVDRRATLGRGRPPVEGFGRRGGDGLFDAMRKKPLNGE